MKKWQMVISFANVVFSFLNVYCVYIFLYHDNLSVPQYWICLSAVIYRCAIHLYAKLRRQYYKAIPI